MADSEILWVGDDTKLDNKLRNLLPKFELRRKLKREGAVNSYTLLIFHSFNSNNAIVPNAQLKGAPLQHREKERCRQHKQSQQRQQQASWNGVGPSISSFTATPTVACVRDAWRIFCQLLRSLVKNSSPANFSPVAISSLRALSCAQQYTQIRPNNKHTRWRIEVACDSRNWLTDLSEFIPPT